MRAIILLTALICANCLVAAGTADRNTAEKMLNGMPLSFERSAGQLTDQSAEWVGHANGYRVGLDATGATILPASADRSDVVRMEFVNARSQASSKPLDPLRGRSNYLVGRDPSRWIQNLETYGRVEYDGVYEGVDVAWYGNQGQLEYDFLLRPGADPNRIRVRFDGTRKLALEANGDVRIETAAGAMELRLPLVYQEAAGVRKRIEGRYRLRAANEIGFELAAYDTSKPLVIDPTLVYGTYFGTGLTIQAIATDAQGNVYIGGFGDSHETTPGLPLVNAMQEGMLGSRNAFVVKFDPTGTVVLYSTYVGGANYDWLTGLTVDSSGEVMATGTADSTDFPLVNPIQSQGDKKGMPFAFKLNPAGSAFVYSTYLGSSGSNGVAVATDGAGSAYIAGKASATFTASVGAAQSTFGGGSSDAFAAKLGADGKLIYATLLGGGDADSGTAIAADPQGNAYVAGMTRSATFPSSPAGARAGSGGGVDTFVAKLAPDGGAVSWLAVLGGSGDDKPVALSRDSASGTLYIAGTTTSRDLPTTAGVIQPSASGPTQGFIASVAPGGASFGFVTYLGGTKEDWIAGMALDASGRLAVTGSSTSSSFPSVNAIQTAFGGQSVSLYKSGGVGGAWTPADTGLPNSVYALSTDPSGPGTVLAAVDPVLSGTSAFDVGVLRTTNDGTSWTAASARSPVTTYFSARQPTQFLRSAANPAVVYLAYPSIETQGPGGTTNGFTAFGSNDSGATWRALAQPAAGDYMAGMAVSNADANTVVEIGSSGKVYRSTDGGASFTQVSTVIHPGSYGYPVAAGPGGTLLVVTASGLSTSPDFGTSWSVPNYSLPTAFATSPSNPSVIYKIQYAAIFKSTDGGTTWNQGALPGLSMTLTRLQVAPGNSQVLGATDGSFVSVSMDGGASWTASPRYPGWQITGLAVNSSGTVYAAGPTASDAFVAKLSADGKTLLWSTFYAGSFGSTPAGVATTGSGDVWIAGVTSSSNLPVTSDAYRPIPFEFGGEFLARIADATAACSYGIAPSSAIAANGNSASASFMVTAPSGCSWTAVSSDSGWITVASGGAGTGVGAVSVTLASNTRGSTRTGSVNVNGQTFTITQADSGCPYSGVGPSLLPAAGGTFSFAVTAPAGCPWNLVSQSPTISLVSGGSGVGNGTVTLSSSPNGTANLPAASVELNGQGYSLRQASACEYSVSPSVLSNAAGSGTMTVTANLAACSWSVSHSEFWLTAYGSGTGSGTITYTIEANTGPPRTSYLYFQDRQHLSGFPVTITQTVVPLQFVLVAPCRVADTRNARGPYGGPTMTAGSTRAFAVSQSACGIPSTAQAYSLNVTVVPPGRLSYLALWPYGLERPNVSTLNSFNGEVLANAAIVPAGTGGAVNVYVTDPTDVILDINGYFDTPNATTSAFYAALPCRIADTRAADGPFGGPSLTGQGSRDFAVSSSGCGIPSGAGAYSLNVTAVPDEFLAFLTAWPTGQSRPLASTLNSWTGKVVANAAIVPSGTNDSVSVYAYNPTDVILDINGYFARGGRAGALSFYPVTPCRVADTRGAAGPILESGTMRTFGVPASGCNIPNTAAAYAMNVTVVPDGALWYLTAWPAGAGQPNVSTLNSWDGSVVANAAIVPAGADGAISVYASGRTHVILDLNGYFAP